MIKGQGSKFDLVTFKHRSDWLRARSQGIGGSDVAGIMGISPWTSPLQVWMSKTEPSDEDKEPSAIMQFGNIMEPNIKRIFADRHNTWLVRDIYNRHTAVNGILIDLKRPWAQASLDSVVRDEDGNWGVLEIKTASSSKDWANGVPNYYRTQVTQYMSVTGYGFAVVAVFFRDTCEFASYRIDRDEDDIKAVEQLVDDFWHLYVEGGFMPEVIGADGEAKVLVSRFAEYEEQWPIADDCETADLIADSQNLAEQIKKLKQDKQIVDNALMQRIGELGGKGLRCEGKKVTWVRSQYTTFDTKKFIAEHPKTAANYIIHGARNGGIRISDIKVKE